MKNTIIYRYILKELVLYIILSVAFLNAVMTFSNVFSLSKKFLDIGITAADFAVLIIYLQPQLMLFTVPVSLLLSILITYGRLNMDSELIILRGSGMSIMRIARPVFAAGVGCFVLTFLISFYIGPLASYRLKKNTSDIIARRLPLSIQEGVFHQAFKNIVIMPKEKTSENSFRGLFIHDGRKKDPVVIWADEASIAPPERPGIITIMLGKGVIYSVRGEAVTEIAFDRYFLALKPEVPEVSRANSDLFFSELLKVARTSGDLRDWISVHRRLTLPVLSLLLMFLGLPLFPIAGKTGRIGGLGVSIAVYTAYYLSTIYATNLVTAGRLYHVLGGWGPTVILGGCAGVAFYRMSKK